MIRITGDETRDRILSPYFKQWHILSRHMGTPQYMDLIDAWLDNVLKVIMELNKKCHN
jgi:hypothetical protein